MPRNLKHPQDSVQHFDVRRAFADRMLRRMAALDINQSQLGRLVGATQSTVSRWFSAKAGYAMPEGTFMVQLPRALQCDGHWLLTGEGTPAPQGQTQTEAYRAGAQTAYGEMRALVEGRLEGMRLGTSLPLTGPVAADQLEAMQVREMIRLAQATQDARTRTPTAHNPMRGRRAR